MRGKRCCCCCVHCFSRITPAGAGKTFTYRAYVPIAQDHPRRCGENATAWRRLTVLPGSPPQVRGKLNRFKPKFNRFRITPAGAGKTCHHFARKRNGWDHPRRCGENRYQHGNIVDLLGSPPQVRGKRTCVITHGAGHRITPAGAGKTRNHRKNRGKTQDHPRRCGENWANSKYTTSLTGSPPQVRGKLNLAPEGTVNLRITPAGAGKTTDVATHDSIA